MGHSHPPSAPSQRTLVPSIVFIVMTVRRSLHESNKRQTAPAVGVEHISGGTICAAVLRALGSRQTLRLRRSWRRGSHVLRERRHGRIVGWGRAINMRVGGDK